MKIVQTIFLITLTSLFTLSFSRAGDWGDKAPMEPKATYSEDSWEFTMAPYAFLSSIDGSLGIGAQTAEFSSDFSDILSEIDFAMFLALEARKNRFAIINDFTYVGLSPGGARPGSLYNQIDVELDMFIWNGIATYRFFDEEDWFLEVGGGLRFTYLSTEVSAHSTALRTDPILAAATGLPPFANATSTSRVWDGVGAIRFGYNFSDRWILRAYGDIGGGDSKMTWQAMVNLGYVMSDKSTLLIGYRHLDYEFVKGITSFDMSMSGPQIGVAIKF